MFSFPSLLGDPKGTKTFLERIVLCSLASRIEMSKDALPENACQLESRYWRITNAKGDVEEVQGPGVVGK